MGSLAVSRAFGNRDLKSVGEGILIVDPDITTFKLIPEDEFIILATDGLWDVMPSQAVIDMVRDIMMKEGKKVMLCFNQAVVVTVSILHVCLYVGVYNI